MVKIRCLLAASLFAVAAPAVTAAAARQGSQTAPLPQGTQAPAAPASPAPAAPARAAAPQPTGTLPLCGGMYQIGPPAKLPPAGSGPVIYQVAACFEKQ